MDKRVFPRGCYDDGRGKIRFSVWHNGKNRSTRTAYTVDKIDTDSGLIEVKAALNAWRKTIKTETSLDRKQERQVARQKKRERLARTFGEVAQEWLSLIEKGKPGRVNKVRSESTRQSYRQILEFFWQSLHNIPIAEITPDDLFDVIEDRSDIENARTWNNNFTPCRQVFKYALRINEITQAPTHVLSSTGYEVTEPDPYDLHEKQTLLKHLDKTPYGNFFRLAFATGMRTGELLGLKWNDFDGSNLYVHNSMVNNKEKGATKNFKRHHIYLGDDGLEVFENMVRPISGGFVFKRVEDYKPPKFTEWTRTDFIPLDQAKRFVHRLELTTELEWRQYATSGDKPDNIPFAVRQVYRAHGWQSMHDFLGVDPGPMTNAKDAIKAFRQAHEATGVRAREGNYPWRHTYISETLSEGVEPNLVAEMVGDLVSTVLKHYYQFIPNVNKEMVVRNARNAINKAQNLSQTSPKVENTND